MKIQLADPETCRTCKREGRVIDSRRLPGYRRRRHECPACGRRWTSWQTLVDPKRLRLKPVDTPAEALSR